MPGRALPVRTRDYPAQQLSETSNTLCSQCDVHLKRPIWSILLTHDGATSAKLVVTP